jgi:hypothetical protein
MKIGEMMRAKEGWGDPLRPRTGVILDSYEEYAHPNIGIRKETNLKILWDTGEIGVYWESTILHSYEVIS